MNMTATLLKPEPCEDSTPVAAFRVKRTDISFQDVAGDKVRITVRVQNADAHPSQPTVMLLQAAPLGAFVPWRPLDLLRVPAMEPGGEFVLSTEVPRPHPMPLGGFAGVPPRKVLGAINAAGPLSWLTPPGNPQFAQRLLLLALMSGDLPRHFIAQMKSSLPPDVLGMLQQGSPHWAGNINVFIGQQLVERHVANALRVYPGRNNLALFVVGDQVRPDAYAFQLTGLGLGWRAMLFGVTNKDTLVVGEADAPITDLQWVETDGQLLLTLLTCRPPDAEPGCLEVCVTQRSTGNTATVEFNLDPSAQGVGCYYT
jgi:hypothetical protein